MYFVTSLSYLGAAYDACEDYDNLQKLKTYIGDALDRLIGDYLSFCDYYTTSQLVVYVYENAYNDLWAAAVEADRLLGNS